jgi:hypothetical protein
MTLQGEVDFLNKQGIINLGDSNANGQAIAYEQILPLKSISHSILPSSGIPVPSIAYVPDNPVEGKSLMFFDGTGWYRLLGSPSKIDSPIRTLIMSGSSITPITSIGISLTTTGTVNLVQAASGSAFRRYNRIYLSSGATAGSIGSIRSTIARYWGGSAAGQGGWDINIPFGFNNGNLGLRCFLGLDSNTSAATNVDPLTSTTGSKVGIAINDNTGNWNLINNVSGVAPTVLNLTGFPYNDAISLYQLRMTRASNSSQISYEVKNLENNFSISGILTTNIPPATTYTTLKAWATNNTVAANCALVLGEITIDWNS